MGSEFIEMKKSYLVVLLKKKKLLQCYIDGP